MIGFKMLNKDMSSKYGNMTYELGKLYEIEGGLVLCHNGFHFCSSFAECLGYYRNIEGDKRLFKVDSLDGEVIKEDEYSETYCSSKIKLIEEIEITEDFLESHWNDDNWDWGYMVKNQKLSEKFIERHWNDAKWDWKYLVKYQNLTEDFLERHWNDAKWDWDYAAIFRNLSEDFIKRHLEDAKWSWLYIVKNQNLSEELKSKIKEVVVK